MKTLKVRNYEIPYQIAKKTNKNTYFYFKKDGYIQINLSKHQSEKDALDYIIENSDKFLNKFISTSMIRKNEDNAFSLLGSRYEVLLSNHNTIEINHDLKQINLPTNDLNNPIIKQFYKNEMFMVIEYLKSKHKDNGLVDISNVIYNTRFTHTRHGSCNTRKRRINLNLHLVKYDIKYIEYVFLHEISHLKHPNHSSKFYDLLKELCPNYKQLKSELRNIYR